LWDARILLGEDGVDIVEIAGVAAVVRSLRDRVADCDDLISFMKLQFLRSIGRRRANEGNKRGEHSGKIEGHGSQFVNLHQLFLDALAKKPASVKGNWLTRDGVHMQPVGDALMALGALRAFGVPDDKLTGTAK
jgi:hypothetical protein